MDSAKSNDMSSRNKVEDADQQRTGNNASIDLNASTAFIRNKSSEYSWVFKVFDGFCVSAEDIKKLPFERQEQVLIRDLIYSFSGVPVSHIKSDISSKDLDCSDGNLDILSIKFKINEGFHSVFQAFANELLPLIGYHICVQSYVEEYNIWRCGRVHQALAAELQDFLDAYYELQAALEAKVHQGKIRIQNLSQTLKSPMTVMGAFAKMVTSVRNEKLNCAQLLSRMHSLVQQYKDQSDVKKTLEKTLISVTQFYMTMIQLWTQKGIIYDPHKEFFIVDTESKHRCNNILPEHCSYEYWETRYRLYKERLPSFFEDQAERIFHAGKYLNVLRHCNVKLSLLQIPLTFSFTDDAVKKAILSSYELSSGKLLDTLRNNKIRNHLVTVGNVFLLQNYEFVDSVVFNLKAELKRNADHMIPDKLPKLLSNTIQLLGIDDANLLQCQLIAREVAHVLGKVLNQSDQYQVGRSSEHKQQEQGEEPEALALCGYEVFTFSYNAPWPLNLMLHKKAITKLQLIHRVLFFLRYVQLQMTTSLRAQCQQHLETTQSRRLRDRMLISMVGLERYMTHSIIEPQWKAVLKAVDNAKSFDELQTQFTESLDHSLRWSLLTEETSFVKALFTLGNVCLSYDEYIQNIDKTIDEFNKDTAEYEKEFWSFVKCIDNLIIELMHHNDTEEYKLLKSRLENITSDAMHESSHKK